MTNRPLLWDDEPLAEPRYRRVRQGVPRVLPGMPLEFESPEGDESPRLKSTRIDKPEGRRWRSASTVGKVFITLGALVALGGLTWAGLLLKTCLERDARFRIAGSENIQVTGLAEVSRAEVLPVFGEDIGRNVFYVPLKERKRELEAIPWIERATVMRLLPDRIRVSVVERRPVAFTRQGSKIGLVDANGVLLTMPARAMAERHYSFPVLTGIDPADSQAARKVRVVLYLQLMSELDANGQHRSQQISEIDLTDPEDARVLLSEQGADILAHFGEDRFLERYERYQAHIAEWRQQYPHLTAVDLRYDQQVVLEMAAGKEAADDGPGPATATDNGAGKDGASRGTDSDAGALAMNSQEPMVAQTAETKAPDKARGAIPAGSSGTSKSTAKKRPGKSGRHAEAKRAALKTGRKTIKAADRSRAQKPVAETKLHSSSHPGEDLRAQAAPVEVN